MKKAFAYTNRMEVTYYLCEIATKSGKSRRVFSREVKGKPVSSIPDGYEVAENVNGQVSLRKIQPREIFDVELHVIERTLKRHSHLSECRVEIKKNTIIVYRPSFDSSELLDDVSCGLPSLLRQSMADSLRKMVSYSPEMRFLLVDKKRRRFEVERMCYRSCVDGWLSVGTEAALETLAKKYLPHIGKESFYDLW